MFLEYVSESQVKSKQVHGITSFLCVFICDYINVPCARSRSGQSVDCLVQTIGPSFAQVILIVRVLTHTALGGFMCVLIKIIVHVEAFHAG